MTIIADV